ncbi:MAG: hypothetical protein AB1656_22965 [Candidatus Omnitrophota bacterium]
MKKAFWSITLVSLLLAGGYGQVFGAEIYTHWNLGPDWVTGDGVYAIVDESATNKVMISAALDNTDPKHAWINKDFGTDYTVRCDVSMESWQEGHDLSRAGIAAMIQPDGVGGGSATEDRGVCLLIHQDANRVQFLNDMEAWQDPPTVFAWKLKTWYTFEMTVSGTKVSGKITEKAKPTNTIDIPAWENYNGAAKRVGGFVGITASTLGGLIAMYDNFQVLVNGEVKFSDDFQTPGDPMPAASGLSDSWVIGEAGMYLVKNGVLYGVATSNVDPKHAWFNQELEKGGRIMGYCKMLSWEAHDHSRSGLGIHIQPHGAGTGRQPSETTPGEDRGLNLLFHDNVNRVQFLNDMRAWGPAITFAWKVDTWYLFDLQSDGNQVSGSITNVAKPSDSVILAPWTYDKDQPRVNGYAGLTASTRRGQICAWDNIVIFDASGAKVFSDDFQGGTGIGEWSLY